MTTLSLNPIDARGRDRRSTAFELQPSNAWIDRGRRGRMMRLALFGVLWGIVVTGVEIPGVPYTADSVHSLSMMFFWQGLQWSIGGEMVAFALWLSTRDGVRWWRLAVLVPLVAAINGGAFFLWALAYPAVDPMPASPAPWASIILYCGWLTLIYGSAAALIYALRRGIDQTTTALQGLSLARERNEASLAEARVSAMVERIEPSFLLDVMDTARRQYLVDAERAEATLNACTEFLRCAMPPLRSGHSTVAAELELAAAYLALRDCMAGRDPAARIDRHPGDGSRADLDEVALPPMTVLPILEQMLAKQSDDVDAAIVIDVSASDASVAIRIEAACLDRLRTSDAFDAEWLAALSTRLTRVCGRDAAIRCVTEPTEAPTLYVVVPRHNDPTAVPLAEERP